MPQDRKCVGRMNEAGTAIERFMRKMAFNRDASINYLEKHQGKGQVRDREVNQSELPLKNEIAKL